MKDKKNNTRYQLVDELGVLRQRITELETLDPERPSPEQTGKWMGEVQDKEPSCFRILAVDDDRTALDFYQAVLCPPRGLQGPESTTGDPETNLFANRSPGTSAISFDVILCHQGNKAVETVQAAIEGNRPFAVAFLDIRMPPGPDGVWTAEHIRALDPYIQVVMITAYSDVDPADIAYRVPPVERLFYVHKPFDPQEIRQFALALGAKWYAERQLRKIHEDLEDRVAKRTAELTKANEQLRHEITERKRVEEALERQDKERIEFINALIHEIKTPLTAMLASSELLKEELSADPSLLSDLAENLNTTIHNLNLRISELMEFAKVQSTGFVLHLQPVDIHQLAQHIAAQVTALLRNKRQTLNLQLPTSLPLIEADPERVLQIFLNLLTNASKFSPPHSEIYLRAYPTDTELILEVRDSAPRIGPKENELIFKPHYQGKKGGCGLGLFVCKCLAELQGGKIWVETQANGNSFKFSLPLTEKSRPQAGDEI